MRRYVASAVVVVVLATLLVAACGPDPKRTYAEAAVAMVGEWHDIIDRWNAAPGDAKVATDFADLAARARALTAPREMQAIHKLFLTAVDAEQRSFELWALGKKQESAFLHAQVLDTIDKFSKALRNLGLVE